MEKRGLLADGFFKCKNVESLLLMAVLGERSVRESALSELRRRRVLKNSDDFEDSFMTNLSVV